MPRSTLFLFTGSYPYSVAAENTFLPQEIEVLRQHFQSVVIVPARIGGTRDTIPGGSVRVDDSLARYIGSWPRKVRFAAKCATEGLFWRELRSHWRVFLVSGNALARALYAMVLARMTEQWIARQAEIRPRDSLLYSWWFDEITLGLGFFGATAGVPVITRVHGRDLYEERQKAPYLPFRPVSLQLTSRVYSVSTAGAQYLRRRYPSSAEKIAISRIGTDDPGFAAAPSSDGVFRIVSCSLLLPVKRVDLIARGIAAVGQLMPSHRFTWTHIGDGAAKPALSGLVKEIMPSNVEWTLPDYPRKRGLYEYYRVNPVDLFMNTSASEGVPVGTMEAISVGIPVLATDVGGNSEIVGRENGRLLSQNPDPREIAEAIRAMVMDPATVTSLRNASREKWRASYSAARNYAAFAREISAL